MLSFLKKNLFIILFIIFVIVSVFICANKSANELNQSQKRKDYIALKCETDLKNEVSGTDDAYVKYCEKMLEYKDVRYSFYNYFSDMIADSCGFLSYFALFIVLIPSLYYVCKLLKNTYIVNYLTRKNYLSFLKCLFGKAYKFVWILPLLAFIMICISLMNGVSQTNTIIFSLWMSDITNNIYLFIILYLINIFMYSCIYINLGLIVARYQNNYYLSIVLSYVILWGLELFFELFSTTGICRFVFGDYCSNVYFNIINEFTFNDYYGTLPLMLFSFVMLIISFVGVFLVYSNQEKLVIKSERYWRSK